MHVFGKKVFQKAHETIHLFTQRFGAEAPNLNWTDAQRCTRRIMRQHRQLRAPGTRLVGSCTAPAQILQHGRSRAATLHRQKGDQGLPHEPQRLTPTRPIRSGARNANP